MQGACKERKICICWVYLGKGHGGLIPVGTSHKDQLHSVLGCLGRGAFKVTIFSGVHAMGHLGTEGIDLLWLHGVHLSDARSVCE